MWVWACVVGVGVEKVVEEAACGDDIHAICKDDLPTPSSLSVPQSSHSDRGSGRAWQGLGVGGRV